MYLGENRKRMCLLAAHIMLRDVGGWGVTVELRAEGRREQESRGTEGGFSQAARAGGFF